MLECRDRGADVAAEGAVLPRDTPSGEFRERLAESLALGNQRLDRVLCRVDGAVEHQRAHVLRKRLGVGGADPGAIGVAEVGQLAIAEHRAQHVHVLDDLARAEVGEHLRTVFGALHAFDAEVLLLRLLPDDALG